MNKKILEKCYCLVLCSNELFFQTEDGDTLFTWYPVCKEAANVCSLFFNKPLSYDGLQKQDSEKIINDVLRIK